MADEVLIKLLIATAAGLVIGIERGWAGRMAEPGQRAAGIRTFGLAGLAGGVCALLDGSGIVLGVLLAGIAALLAVAYVVGAGRAADLGLTTEFALLLAPLLGALTTRHPLDGIAVAALVAALLGFKQELHRTVERLGREELLATLQLLIVAAVILPLLPDAGLGPWASINPRTTGLLVLLLLGLSYLSYFAIRIIGPRRGLLLTALFGGFTSSTAITLMYARLSRQADSSAPLLSAGITLASAMMAPRIWLVISAIRPELATRLGLPLAILGLVPLLYAALVALRTTNLPAHETAVIRNPLAIRAALVMASAIAALAVLIRAAETWLGDAGTYAVAALSGVLDVDAISVALAQGMSPGINRSTGLALTVASNGILIAMIVNTLAKAVLAATVGTAALGRRCAGVLLTAGLAAGAVAVFA